MNDAIVLIVILAILGGAIYKLYLNKKNNSSITGCSSCPMGKKCADYKEGVNKK